jgi:osmotically-inducible protein OsmY
MLRKLLFGAAAAGAVAWLAKNQDTAKAYIDRYSGQLKGAAQGVTPGAGREPAEERLNDPALARKVESEIFRGSDVPREKVSVNVQDGVVQLRGELDSQAQIDGLAAAAHAVDGVQGVEVLLHVTGTQSPTVS